MSMTVAILLASGAAFAAIIGCSANPCLGTNDNDLIKGHQAGKTADQIYGYGGSDILYGEAGNDFIDARENRPRPTTKPGSDSIYGGGGNDLIYAHDGYVDTIDCGGGKKDKVYYDDNGIDTVAKNCEKKFPRVIL
jgi:Ca2+-binding RTX toxin-like protein